MPAPLWKRHFYELVAAEVSSLTRYYDRLVQWGRTGGDDGDLLNAIDCPDKSLVADGDIPDLSTESDRRTAVLLFGTLNHDYDIEGLLTRLHSRLSRTSRVVIVTFNPYLQWLYRLALWLGLKRGTMPTTFITLNDLRNICRLSGFEIVRIRTVVYSPWRFLGLGSLINFVMPVVPLLRQVALTTIIVIRPVGKLSARRESVSVVIPARNERGNIAAAVSRMPDMDCDVELIFVEGHSTDGTWEEIQRVCAEYAGAMRMQAFQQTGRGKADAVRLGFSRATGDVLTILDADLTMPPELLTRFVDAYRTAKADFINGNRVTYPMEGEAMRFLNRLGNVFFAKALTWMLGVRLGDCLCGTKLVARHDYARMERWRADFGDIDPFGDFELLFPAAVLGIGIIDVPIRYRARTYGSTNINRFRHGLMLLRMTVRAFVGIKAGRIPARAR
ncbi:MAG TPA: glycosyltransferase [Gemmatimonadaceae bacterium]